MKDIRLATAIFSLFLVTDLSAQEVEITADGGTYFSQYGSSGSPETMQIENLFDHNSTTKYLVWEPDVWIVYEAKTAYKLTGLAMTSANNKPDRDPLIARIYGKNNNPESSWGWESISYPMQTSWDFPNRFQRIDIDLDETDAYRYYRIRFENNSGSKFQLADLELYGFEYPPAPDAEISYEYTPCGVRVIVTSGEPEDDISWWWNESTNAFYTGWGQSGEPRWFETSNREPITLSAKHDDFNGWGGSIEITLDNQQQDVDPGEINGDKSICSGASAGTIDNVREARVGESNPALYYWQYSHDGTNWIYWTKTNVYTPHINPGAVTQDTWFRRETRLCGTYFYTEPVLIDVVTEVDPGVIEGDQIVCFNQMPEQLLNTEPPKGASDLTYEWQVYEDGKWGSAKAPNHYLKYDPPILSETRKFRRRAKSCGSTEYSNEITVTVYPDLDPGEISAEQDLRLGEDASELSSVLDATGGDGTYAYQWFYSENLSPTDNDWLPLDGETNQTYDPEVLAVSTVYRREVNSCSQTKYSNSIQITIHQMPELATASDASRCGEGEVTLSATPGAHADEVRWYDAPTGGNLLYTGLEFTSILTNTTTFYAASVNSSIEWEGSDRLSVQAEVIDLPLVYTISLGGTSCYGVEQAVSQPSTQGENYTYHLLKNGEPTGQSQLGTNASISFSNIIETGIYTIEAEYRGCRILMNGTADIVVYDELTAGAISGSQTLCYNEDPITLIEDAPATGGVNITYQWQSSTTSAVDGFSDISGATSATYDPDQLTETTWFRRVAKSAADCGVKETNSVEIMVEGYCAGAFITKWETTEPNESITIPTIGSNYDYSVDWGDGTVTTDHDGDATHIYAEAGVYVVSVSGGFPRIYFNNSGDKNKIRSIEQWGEIRWESMERAFYGCYELTSTANDAPDLTEVKVLTRMFASASSFNADLSSWDVSGVNRMDRMFAGASSFDGDISTWQVGSVSWMNSMFSSATSFNGNISNWDVHYVSFMDRMFDGAVSFNSDVSGWDVGRVGNMDRMFYNAQSFNQDISSWDVSRVSDFADMFEYARAFDQNLSSWDISSAQDMTGMFNLSGLSQDNYKLTLEGWGNLSSIPQNISLGAYGLVYCEGAQARAALIEEHHWQIFGDFESCPESRFITKWETTSPGEYISVLGDGNFDYNFHIDWGDGKIQITNHHAISHKYDEPGIYTVSISGEFPCISLNHNENASKIISVEQWGNQEWKSMNGAFAGCSNLVLNATDTPDFSKVISMWRMFDGATLVNGDFSEWNVESVTRMDYLFRGAVSFNGNISTWDVSNVTTMKYMFGGATSFNNDIGMWKVQNVEDMTGMFSGSDSFNQDISLWDVSEVENMSYMFSSSSFNGDISLWNVNKVTDMNHMFMNSIFNGDLSSWNVSAVTDMSGMFRNSNFNGDLSLWNVGNVNSMNYMFHNASSFNKSLSSWNISNMSDMSYMLDFSGMSEENYELTLSGWSALDVAAGETEVPRDVPLGAKGLTFCESSARDSLIDFGWDFTGDIKNCPESAFITTWRTTENNEQITIPTNIGYYTYFVDWGDGSIDNNLYTDDASHIYELPGTYEIAILGSFPGICFNNKGDKNKILSIEQWGGMEWTHMNRAFYGCENLTMNATDVPNLSQVNYMYYMFCRASSFNGNLSEWNVSSVIGMDYMFNGATSFNQDLFSWDISNVESMNGMLNESGLSQENYDNTLIGWNTLDVAGGETAIPRNISLGAVHLSYCNGLDARTNLVDNYGWTISYDTYSCSGARVSADAEDMDPKLEQEMEQIAIYPNPAKHYFTLQTGHLVNPKMEIYDMVGNLILQKKNLVAGDNLIETDQLPKGFVLVRLTSGAEMKTMKLLIE